jgi:hypothetical protein
MTAASRWDPDLQRWQHPQAEPPARVLLCLGPCHGEFYLPLDAGDHFVCPVDSEHPVAVYSGPVVYGGDR